MGKDEKNVTKKSSTKKDNTTKKESEVKETKKTTDQVTKTSKKQVEKNNVKNSDKKNEPIKKEDVKKESESKKEEVKQVAETKLEVKPKKVSSVSSDKVVIFTIVGVCILIALGVFGFVFYKSNYESVVSTDYGNVSKAEYTVYYKMFAPMLEYYGYKASDLPQVIANKAGTDKVLLNKAKEAGIKLTNEELAEIETTFADEEQVKAWKEAQINVDILRRLFEEDYMISAYIKKIADEATDDEMIQYLKNTYGDSADLYEYNTRHILIKTSKTGDDGKTAEMSDQEKAAALQKAESILSRVKAGEDFGALAKELSEDEGTAVNGGVFVFYDGDSVMEQYEQAAKSLSDGAIYDSVVETTAGYHIIKLDKKVENGRVNSENDRSYYANEAINKIAADSRVDIQTDVLNALVESITGVATEENKEESNGQSEESNEQSGESNGASSEEEPEVEKVEEQTAK